VNTRRDFLRQSIVTGIAAALCDEGAEEVIVTARIGRRAR
jgi:hypothetical protein